MTSGAAVIVLYDGCCSLCIDIVTFCEKRIDHRRGEVRFVTAQSKTGRVVGRLCGKNTDQPTSVVAIDRNQCTEMSDAVLQITAHLTRPWSWLRFLAILVPRFLRDAIYRFIALKRTFCSSCQVSELDDEPNRCGVDEELPLGRAQDSEKMS